MITQGSLSFGSWSVDKISCQNICIVRNFIYLFGSKLKRDFHPTSFHRSILLFIILLFIKKREKWEKGRHWRILESMSNGFQLVIFKRFPPSFGLLSFCMHIFNMAASYKLVIRSVKFGMKWPGLVQRFLGQVKKLSGSLMLPSWSLNSLKCK